MTISSKLCSDMLGYQGIQACIERLSCDFLGSVSFRLWQLDTLPLLQIVVDMLLIKEWRIAMSCITITVINCYDIVIFHSLISNNYTVTITDYSRLYVIPLLFTIVGDFSEKNDTKWSVASIHSHTK